MRLGFFTMPVHPLGKSPAQSFAEDREAFILADRLGYSEAYCGEHSTDLAENVTSTVAFLASLAYETTQIRLGTGTVNLPNSHPVRVAAEVAMLDHMTGGRVNFGISPGGLLSDAEAFGTLDKDRNAMFLECIDMVLAIWSQEPPYDLAGEFWNVSTARTLLAEIGQGAVLKPLQQPHPPVVGTAVAPFSKGVTAMAARGWEPISANFLLPKWVATHWPNYREGCAAAGRPVNPHGWRVARSIFVAEDSATARAYALDPNGPYVSYFRGILTKMRRGGRLNLFKEDQAMPDEAVTLDHVVDRLLTFGSPDEVIEKLHQFRDETGPFNHLIYAGHDWADPVLGRRSMELMAEKVIPKLSVAIAAEREAV
ncbi:LLM class flavin-dependent oxidoreductase [Paracoccus thiocyanatus]|uniref:LLM class flavin-dependent oxidoreductase n=1 Tax=Paracoccus thiocyanatus TaxID=34006 RepID=A0A3D8PH02_9RHOB|nr:LLM class flavin-dependent oxidoreductase [Paracoccus thiocyanatus]RDW14767.1 LLM class flavin-dependent oxidoreductase [Paracoccus thiocyanatus]